MFNENNIELALTNEIQGLETDTSVALKNNFLPFFEQAEKWKAKADMIVITDVSQTAEMKIAREARLALKQIRVDVEKKRKELKEESLKKGKAIDGIANVIKSLIEPIEAHLEKQEKFVEIQENLKKDKLESERISLLEPYEIGSGFYDLRNMPEEHFQNLLESTKIAHLAKIEREKQAEIDRITKEKAEAEERQKIRQENERLRTEAAERVKQFKTEQEAKEKELQEQKEKVAAALKERQKLENELKAKQEADAKAKREAEMKAENERKAILKAQKQAEKAPDFEKLLAFSAKLGAIEYPTLKNRELNNYVQAIKDTILGILIQIENTVKG